MQGFNKKVAPYAAAVLMFGAAQGVHAHAGFKDQITEGSTTNTNAVTITHGCATNVGGEGNTPKDVIAFSAVFPDFSDTKNVIIRNSTGTVPAQTGDGKTTATGTGTVGDELVMSDLSSDIVGATNAVAMTASITTVTGGGNIFVNTIPLADAKGNVRGWQSWSGSKPFNGSTLLETVLKPDGKAYITTTGFAPFRIGAIQFQKTSCAKTLKIRVAVANWCGKGTKSYSDAGRTDIWIGTMTSKFNDQLTMPNASKSNGGSGAIFWPTLTVNRNLTSNPLPADCSGKYDTVYIEPSQADIDALLPISKAKYPAGAGELYWPTAK